MGNERKNRERDREGPTPQKIGLLAFSQMYNLAGAKWGIGTIKQRFRKLSQALPLPCG
jgi:hypothetical protein